MNHPLTNTLSEIVFLEERCHQQAARIDALEAALREAERFMAYFADGATSFVGPGTPTSCLAKIRAALELV
jgi:hypothetical protein